MLLADIRGKLWECVEEAERHRKIRAARHRKLVERLRSDHPGDSEAVNIARADIAAAQDGVARKAAGDNAFYTSQATMWAAVLQAEIAYHNVVRQPGGWKDDTTRVPTQR